MTDQVPALNLGCPWIVKEASRAGYRLRCGLIPGQICGEQCILRGSGTGLASVTA